MSDFLSKIIFLQGNQLERLLDIDVIAQQRPFLAGNSAVQKVSSVSVPTFSYRLNYLLNTYKLILTLLTF